MMRVMIVVQPMMAIACQMSTRTLPMPAAASIVAVNCVGSSRQQAVLIAEERGWV